MLTATASAQTQVQQILFIQNQEYSLHWLRNAFEQNGYKIKTLSTTNAIATALSRCQHTKHLLVLLDVDRTMIRNEQICRKVRRHTLAPIIAFVEDGQPDDVVAGIQQGADVVICKPINTREAIARIQGVLRRTHPLTSFISPPAPSNHANLLTIGDMILDIDNQQLKVNDRTVGLTSLEKKLLIYLINHPNQVLTKQELLREVWGHVDDKRFNLVEVAIRRLRLKIEQAPSMPERLITMHRTGYMFIPHE